MSDIPNALSIVTYLHCRLSVVELPPGTSPRDYARVSVGMTERGFRVWCNRHDVNVAHVDFEGCCPRLTRRARRRRR
jgi:hypothetical protein